MNIRVDSDAIVYMFAFLKAGTMFKVDKPAIHSFFHKMSKKEEFAALFHGMIFNANSRSFPYSENVENAIDRLVRSGGLSLINADVYAYEVSAVLAKKEVKELFSESECGMLQKIADMFQKEIGTWLPAWHKDNVNE